MSRTPVVVFVLAIVVALLSTGRTLSAQAPDITGKWVFDVQTDAGSGSPVFTFKQEGEKLTGHYQGQFGEADLVGTVKGSEMKFSFKADAQGQVIQITYEGTIEGKDAIKGTLDIAGLATGTFTGKRQ